MVRVYIMFILAYSVVVALLLLRYAGATRLEQNVTSIENTLDSLTHNVSSLRKDVNISVDVLKLYLNQETAFRNTLQQQLNVLLKEVTLLKQNNSVLKLLYEDDLQQLEFLKSAMHNLQQELTQMTLAMLDNTAKIDQVNGSLSQLSFSMQKDRSHIESINKSLSASLQQDRSDIISINNSLSASLQQEVTYLRQQFSGNLTSVQSKLAQYIESGELLFFPPYFVKVHWQFQLNSTVYCSVYQSEMAAQYFP